MERDERCKHRKGKPRRLTEWWCNKYHSYFTDRTCESCKSVGKPSEKAEPKCPSCGGKLKREVFDKVIRTSCGMCPYELTENKSESEVEK